MTSLLTSPPQSRLARTLVSVTLQTLRSTAVITGVALAVFALREQVFHWPTLRRVARDHVALFVLVFLALWIWRFWKALREPARARGKAA